MTETETQCLKTLQGWNQPISLFHRDKHKTQEGETAYSVPDGWPGGNEIQVLLGKKGGTATQQSYLQATDTGHTSRMRSMTCAALSISVIWSSSVDTLLPGRSDAPV